MTKNSITCPDCQGKLKIKKDIEKGEVVTCPDCNTDFEAIKINPLEITHAPEAQEDWGE